MQKNTKKRRKELDAKRWKEKGDLIKKKKKEHREFLKNNDQTGYEELLEKERLALRNYQRSNRDYVNQKQKEYREANKEKWIILRRKYREENKDRINLLRRLSPHYMGENALKKIREHRENNRDYYRLISKKYRQNYPEKIRYHSSIRERRLENATIGKQMFKKEMEDIFKARKEISKLTGIEHHADHIVPIVNKLVCGLHVPWNLRIIPREENLKKKNKLDTNLILS